MAHPNFKFKSKGLVSLIIHTKDITTPGDKVDLEMGVSIMGMDIMDHLAQGNLAIIVIKVGPLQPQQLQMGCCRGGLPFLHRGLPH